MDELKIGDEVWAINVDTYEVVKRKIESFVIEDDPIIIFEDFECSPENIYEFEKEATHGLIEYINEELTELQQEINALGHIKGKLLES